jgi:penicillin-binding protein 2
VESCDVYFYQVSQKLGVDTLAKYATSLGLGKKTGIILEHEKGGLVPTSEWKLRRHREPWQDGETLSVSIGQGFNLTTPLQICQMTAAAVNGGTLYRPLLINAILDPEGAMIKEFTPIVEGRVEGEPEYLELIKDALVGVVHEKKGTATVARVKGITVGGKTGTAQVVRLAHLEDIPEEEIPYKYRDHAWFTSFAPADDPVIAVTVLVEHGMHGGSTAGPIAQKVLERYFNLPQALTPPGEKPAAMTAQLE